MLGVTSKLRSLNLSEFVVSHSSHIPADYVVNRWLLEGECSSPLDFP
jgi:hypothetical protein